MMNSDGYIIGHGVGTLMTGDKIITGIWDKGYLKTPSDPAQATKAKICMF